MRTCDIEWCDRPHYGHGFCRQHLRRHQSGSDMNEPFRQWAVRASICAVESCGRREYRVGLCATHSKRKAAGQDMSLPIRERNRGRDCSHFGCLRMMRAGGYCLVHYSRKSRGADMDAPIRGKGAAGEWSKWFVNSGGYVQRTRTVGGKRQSQLQHREVMKERLGRDLLPKENVHHKNGLKDDNEPGNLELWTKSQPAGQRVEDKIAWAKDFLAQYENFNGAKGWSL